MTPQPQPLAAWDALSAAQVEVLARVVAGRLACTKRSELERGGCDPIAVAALIDLGYLVAWETDRRGRSLPSPLVTLTPWGAWALRQVLAERWERGSEIEVQFAGVRLDEDGEIVRRERKVPVRTAVEVPVWRAAEQVDEVGDPIAPRGMLAMPGHARLRSLPFPELVVDTAPGPLEELIAAEDVVMVEARTRDGRPDLDPETGAVRREKLRILGMEVSIDPRIKGKVRAKGTGGGGKGKGDGRKKGSGKGRSGGRPTPRAVG